MYICIIYTLYIHYRHELDRSFMSSLSIDNSVMDSNLDLIDRLLV